MTVDTRCIVICDQGVTLSGSLSEDHIDTTNVLAKVRGTVVLDGIKNLARGSAINVAYQVPGYNEVSRFSRRLRVLSCQVDPYDEVTNLEVGCVLTLRQDLNPGENYRAADFAPAWYQAIPEAIKQQMPVPIYASGVLGYCLTQLGLTAAAGNTPLVAAQLRSNLDLGQGYVQVINELLLSESCYGFINAAEQFVVRPIIPGTVTGPVLTRNELLTLEGIDGGAEPADVIEVVWSGGLEVPEDLELTAAPLLPELPANAGGVLNFTAEQAEEVDEFIALTAAAKDITEREARGTFNRGVMQVGPAPVDGVISFSSSELSAVKQSAESYASEYSERKQRTRDYQQPPYDEPPPPPDPSGNDPDRPTRQPRPMRDWTYDVSYSTPKTYRITYVGDVVFGEAIDVSESVTHAAKSETTTTYEPFFYYDNQGNLQQEDVVVLRETKTSSVLGAINQTRWKSKRERGSPARAADVVYYTSKTTHEYVATVDGPRVVKEETREFEPRIGFAGGLGIQNWFGVDLGLANVLRSQTQTTYEWDDQADRTKTTVRRWLAIGATSEGATAAAAMAKDLSDIFGEEAPYLYALAIEDLVTAASELVFDGAETRISIGRGNVESRPSPQERAREELQRDPITGQPRNDANGWPGTGGVTRGRSSGGPKRLQLLKDGSPMQSNKSDVYTLPFPADDVLSAEIDGDALFDDWLVRLEITPGKTQEQALRFARAMAYLSFGHAAGVSITTEIRNLPSEPFAPIFIDAAGVSAVFRCNGMSWAWGGDGLIVGADALLHGAAGSVGQVQFSDAWVPVPVAIAGLPVAPATSSNASPKPANTITTPNGFDPLNPTGLWSLLPTNGSDVPAVQRTATAIVEPRNETLPVLAKSRSKASLIAFDYALTATTESLQIKTRTKVRQVTEVLPPATQLTLGATAPAVSVNAPLPVTTLALAPVAPVVAVSVPLPVTSLELTVVPPEVTTTSADVALPVTSLELVGVAPVVEQAGVNLALPSAELAVTGVAPAVVAADPYFSSVSLLLHGDGSGQGIVDSSSYAHTLTISGDVTQSATYSAFGGKSLFFDGTGDYLSAPDGSPFELGAGDWTIEAWIRVADLSDNRDIITKRNLTIDGNNFWLWRVTTAGKLFFLARSGGVDITNVTSTATLSVNTNYWVAVRRVNGSVRLFVNAVEGTTVTTDNTTAYPDVAVPIYVGCTLGLNNTVGAPFNGYIDSLRLTKGVGRSVVVPTAEFPTTGAVGGGLLASPTFSNVALLLPFDGANGSTAFSDGSSYGVSVTANGNAQISTAQSVFGGAAGLFDGSNDYLAVTSNNFNFGTGDYAIQGRIRRTGDTATGSGSSQVILDARTAEPSTQVNLYIANSTLGYALTFYVNGAVRITGSTVPLDTWVAWALFRVGGVTRLYMDGVQVGSSYTDTNNYSATAWTIGGRFAAVSGDYRSFNGYMDDLRVVKAQGLFAGSSYTVANQAHPTS